MQTVSQGNAQRTHLVDVIIPRVDSCLTARMIVLVADVACVISSDCTHKDKGCRHPERAISAVKHTLSK